MKVLHSEIEIYASAERVWKLLTRSTRVSRRHRPFRAVYRLTDFDNFPEWNSFIRQVRGEPKVGERLEVCIQPPGTDAMTFRPTVIKAQPNHELRWIVHWLIPGLFNGEHIFAIDPLSKNHVRFTQTEFFGGLLVPLLAKKLDSNMRQEFENLNQALKIRSEVLAHLSY